MEKKKNDQVGDDAHGGREDLGPADRPERPHDEMVYVVETGCYENRGVAGVYASPEDAIAAHPIPADYKYPETPSAFNASRRGGWQRSESIYNGVSYVSWTNGLDWDDAVEITSYRLQRQTGSATEPQQEHADPTRRSAAQTSD